ncbi:MAG: hypothetical protein U0795_15230 [Pirellulales bacterium]
MSRRKNRSQLSMEADGSLSMPKTSRFTKIATLIMAAIIFPFCLYGFGSKFVEFIHLYRGDVEGEFAITPIVNYLLASSGFFLVLLWAIANGMLEDVERPKYVMLERERELDRLARRVPDPDRNRHDLGKDPIDD